MVNLVECFGQIDCTSIDPATFADIVANNITSSVDSISTPYIFLNWLVDGDKYDSYFSRNQYSRAQRVARPPCANATVNFYLLTDWLRYCHLANDL